MKPLALIAAAVLLAGCSTPAPAVVTVTAPAATASAPSATPTATTASPTPTPTESEADLTDLAPGDRIVTLDDDGAELGTWTVLDGKRTTSPYRDGPLYAAKLKACATQKMTVSSTGWFVVASDDAQYDAASDQGEGDPTPMFPLFDRTVRKGGCLQGWVVFEVDKGTKITHVGVGVGDDVALWKV